MMISVGSLEMPIIKDLFTLQSWVDQVTLRGFSMSPPLHVGNEFMLGLCRGAELSECTCVHMPLDRLQEATAILFGNRERRVYVHALKETMLWFKRKGIDLPAEMFLDVSLAAYLLNPPERDQDEDWRKFQLSSLVREYLKESYLFVYKRVAQQDYPEALYGQLVQDVHYVWRLRPLIDQILTDETLLQPYWELEIMLTSVLADMELRGVGLKKEKMAKALPKVGKALDILGNQLERHHGEPFDPQSNGHVRHFLRQTCGVRLAPNDKIDDDLLKGLALSYVPARKLRQWRRLHQTKEFLDEYADQDRCYPKWWLTRTAVGRIVCTDPALQNLPKYVRHYLDPGPGNVFIRTDYSAFQLRLLAHLSQDPALMAACGPGRKPHDETRDLLLKKGIIVTRAQAKIVNFAMCYGGTAWSLKDNLGLGMAGLKQAQSILEELHDNYPGVKLYLDRVVEELAAHDQGSRSIRSIRGRRRCFNASAKMSARQKRQARNAVVQMLEADVFKKTVLELDKVFKVENMPVQMVLLLHDGIWFTCPSDPAMLKKAKQVIKDVMEYSVQFSVPLVVDFE
jgi:DNA polymerase I